MGDLLDFIDEWFHYCVFFSYKKHVVEIGWYQLVFRLILEGFVLGLWATLRQKIHPNHEEGQRVFFRL